VNHISYLPSLPLSHQISYPFSLLFLPPRLQTPSYKTCPPTPPTSTTFPPPTPVHSSSPFLCTHSHPANKPLDRLPTVSASAALRKLADEGGLAVSTGLKGLDRILGGGWKRGEVTEVWGPPGVGKTACW